VCDVIADAVGRRVTSPGPVNLAFGTRTTLLELLARLESIIGTPIEREHVGSRTSDVRHSQADSTRLQDLFPDITPVELDDALEATVAWFRAGTLEDGSLAGTG